MLLCLADDLTGLVEVAAQCTGLDAEVFLAPPTSLQNERGQTRFINLACREAGAPEAYARVCAVMELLRPLDLRHTFLKIDSAARGPIAALLRGLAESTGARPIPLLVANPDTARSTRAGQIWIGEQPLHLTPFAADPLFPRQHADLPRMLAEGPFPLRAACQQGSDPDGAARPADVIVLDGSSRADIASHVAVWRDAPVAAGAAPFGVGLLTAWSGTDLTAQARPPAPLPLDQLLAIVGTCHPAADQLIGEFESLGGHILALGDPVATSKLPLLLHARGRLGPPQAIAEDMARAACALIERLRPEGLLLTGGETAQCVLGRLGVQRLRAVRQAAAVTELAPLDAAGHVPGRLWMKPGSYGASGLLQQLFGPCSTTV